MPMARSSMAIASSLGTGSRGTETLKVQVVCLFILGTSAGIFRADHCSQRRHQSLPDFRRDLPTHGDHVQSGDGQSVPPHRTIVLYVYGFQGDLQLVAFLQIVAGYDVGHSHLASGLLQIQSWPTVFAGGGERA